MSTISSAVWFTWAFVDLAELDPLSNFLLFAKTRDPPQGAHRSWAPLNHTFSTMCQPKTVTLLALSFPCFDSIISQLRCRFLNFRRFSSQWPFRAIPSRTGSRHGEYTYHSTPEYTLNKDSLFESCSKTTAAEVHCPG